MRLNRGIIAVITALLSFSASAQEDLLWYFGLGQAGLQFDNVGGTPTVANDPAFVIYEAISVVSDCEGNLQFYTDGTKVYDESHTLMTNGSGLLGSQENNANPQSGSSPNGVLVIGDPADTMKYYIFTVGETNSGGANGWRYHIVDMSLPGNGTAQNPMGEVISKNTLLRGAVAEGQAVVGNTCGDSIWVSAHGYSNDSLFAVPITASGGVGSVVGTKIGPVLTNANGSRGSADFNPQGTKFAMAYLWPGGGHVMDFSFSTGVYSNAIVIPGTTQGVYGVEFSGNGEYAYFSHWSFRRINRWDIGAGTNYMVIDEGATGAPGYGDLERGPDGKIYMGHVTKGSSTPITYLSAIENPDTNVTTDIVFTKNFIDVGVAVDIGLPQMFLRPGNQLWKSKINVPMGSTTVCDKGGVLQLTATPACGSWTGGSYVDNNGSFDPSGLSTPGTYKVFYSVGTCVAPDSVEFTVEDCCPPIEVSDLQICEGTSLFNVMSLVDTGIGIWSLTSTPTGNGTLATLSDSLFDASNYLKGSTYVTDGNYELTYTYWNAPLSECPDSAVAVIEVDSFPRDIFLGANSALISICDDTYDIVAKSGLSYTWTTPLTGSSNLQNVSTDGTYYLSVVSPTETCITEDSIEVEFDVTPVFTPMNDTLICGLGTVEIGVAETGFDYLWNNNETTQLITVNSDGTYSVILKSSATGFCPAYDTIDVILAPDLDIDFIGIDSDTTACPALDTIIVRVLDNVNNDQYTWSMGTSISDSSVAIYDFEDGDVVSLLVEDVYGCQGSDQVTLNVYCEIKDPNIPNIITVNEDGINDSFTPIDFPPTEEGTYNAFYPTSNLKVYDRWGLLMYEDNDYPEWDGTNTLGKDCSAGVYYWILDITDLNGEQKKINGFVHLVR